MHTCFQRNNVVETAPLQEEALLFHPRTNTFCVLNQTASFLWTCLVDPLTATQLADKLNQSFEGVKPADALEDVQRTLQEMQSLEFVVAVSTPMQEA